MRKLQQFIKNMQTDVLLIDQLSNFLNLYNNNDIVIND